MTDGGVLPVVAGRTYQRWLAASAAIDDGAEPDVLEPV
jgi:hypothetical protein